MPPNRPGLPTKNSRFSKNGLLGGLLENAVRQSGRCLQASRGSDPKAERHRQTRRARRPCQGVAASNPWSIRAQRQRHHGPGEQPMVAALAPSPVKNKCSSIIPTTLTARASSFPRRRAGGSEVQPERQTASRFRRSRRKSGPGCWSGTSPPVSACITYRAEYDTILASDIRPDQSQGRLWRSERVW